MAAGLPRELIVKLRQASGDTARPGGVRVVLKSGDLVVTDVELCSPERSQISVPLTRPAGELCEVIVVADPRLGFVDEVSVVVRAGGRHPRIVERLLCYSDNGRATTRQFPLPDEHLSVTLSVTPVHSDRVGLPLKVMAFNIWHGGRLDQSNDQATAQKNIGQLLEFIRFEDPDLLFLVETYGTGRLIEQALNRSQPAGRSFRGTQLTRQPDRPADADNLWLYTWLPVAELYPTATTGVLTSFNFGGVRLLLPDGTDLHAFTVWLYHLDNAAGATTQAAVEHALGLEATMSSEQIVATDRSRRLPMAVALLGRLRAHVPDDSATVILGGDFNTLSHLDWSTAYTKAPGHGQRVLDWPVMREFDAAGFTDSYRHANPDAARYPGDTRPGPARLFAPARIDYILTRGERVRVLGSSRRTQRLPLHLGEPLCERYPFYSDHAAVATELVIRGAGPGPASGSLTRGESLDPPQRAVPPPPHGVPVPPAELSASAVSTSTASDAGFAIDGDPHTTWVSCCVELGRRGKPSLSVDLGRTRILRGVRYQPPLNTRSGLIVRYSLLLSTDGEMFEPVSTGEWERDQLPKDIHLADLPARHLQLVSHESVGASAAIAELTVFERSADPVVHHDH